MREHHPEHLLVRVARLEERAEHRHVRLGAGVRLHVRVLGAEQLLRAVDRELLGHVDELAAAVVAPSRVPLGVLVVHRRADRGEDGRARVVLRGDQPQVRPLALQLVRDRLGDLRVGRLQRLPVGCVLPHRHSSPRSIAARSARSAARAVRPRTAWPARAGRSPARTRARSRAPPSPGRSRRCARATAARGRGRGRARRGSRATLFAAICSPWPDPPRTIARSASPADDRAGGGRTERRVVHRRGRVGADVEHLVPLLAQERLQVLLQREPRVVGAERDPHSRPSAARRHRSVERRRRAGRSSSSSSHAIAR